MMLFIPFFFQDINCSFIFLDLEPPPGSPYRFMASAESMRSHDSSAGVLQLNAVDRCPSQMSMVFADGAVWCHNGSRCIMKTWKA